MPTTASHDSPHPVHELVRERYAQAARESDGCCSPGCCGQPDATEAFGAALYAEADLGALPEGAVRASLGCGNPTAVAELEPGEVVLDLGSGGGIDVLLSGRRVGPSGRVYGLDMTDEMLELARENARRAGARNVEFLKGTIEDVPLPATSVDVVISNCVVNLSPDKPRVFREIARVLRPGGRLAFTDVIADPDLDESVRRDVEQWAGCVAGALTRRELEAQLERAGLVDVEVRETHGVHPQAFSAIVRARMPASAAGAKRRAPA